MRQTTQIVSCLLIGTIFACIVVSAQQQLLPQGPPAPIEAPVGNCSLNATKPNPALQKFSFNSCIVAQFAAYLTIGNGSYLELTNAKTNTNLSVCDNSTAKIEPKLVIDFDCGQLEFDIKHTNDSTYVESIAGFYNIGNPAPIFFTNSTPMFNTTQSGHYYKCSSEQSIPLGSNTHLIVSNLALEAYRSTTGTDFYQIPEECPLDSQPVSDLVRIGVGVCLVALVVIVLIAYFIGRRRWSERSSYESV